MTIFPGKVFLQQRVLPSYRLAFLETLADKCRGGLIVFAGEPEPEEAILAGNQIEQATWIRARNDRWLRGGFTMHMQPGLLPALHEQKPDAVILEANPRYFSNRAAITWAAGHGVQVLGWGLGLPRRGFSIRGALGRRFIRGFQGMIAYSQQGAEEYEAAGISAERVFVAPNAVTRAPADMPVRPEPEVEVLHLLFVGRLQARKRIELLLQACAALELRSQVELEIVGDGPDRARLEALAQEVFPNANFTGALEGTALEHAFLRADLFVLPGTGGLAIQQAMAHALPIIAAEGDGSQRDMVRPENGWLVRPGDLADLQRTLFEAISQPEGLRKKGQASFQAVQSTFNIDNMAEVFVDALKTVSGDR